MEVRRLRRDEADALRDLRLRALQDTPWAFGSSYAREREHTPERWQRFADQVESVIYVADDGATLVAMAGGFVPPDTPDAVHLWGMWVAPDARGGGLGRALVEQVVGWARRRGATVIQLDLTDSERTAAAAALYRALGFAPTGERAPLESDTALETILLRRPL